MLALLAAVAYLDYVTGPQMTFTLLYLLPISVCAWFIGRGSATVLCVAAALIGGAIELATHESGLSASLWNVGVRFGVYFTFASLLAHLHAHNAGLPVLRTLNRLLVATACCACALAVMGAMIQKRLPARSGSLETSTSTQPANALADLAAKLQTSLRLSRPVLLGSRDPKGPSCVVVVKAGEVRDAPPTNPGDLNGGPGTTMATLYYFDRQNNKSPMQDFLWHQSRLKTYLANEAASNRVAAQAAHDLSEASVKFLETVNAWNSLPADLKPIEFNHVEDWPSYCMTALDRAVAARDFAAARRWAGELAAATFSLDDLHRWLAFLVENHLAALDFQKQCQTLFASAESMNRLYDPQTTVSQFPAGVLSLNGLGNYYEVERQAERLFSMPPDRMTEVTTAAHLTSGSLWVAPGVRECFLKLQGALTEKNARTFERAAQTPYEHSYLVNMLFRAQRSNSADYLCNVLRKLDKIKPQATVGELMSVLMYRGHSFAGLEWSDRFQPELLKAAEEIDSAESDAEALVEACHWTNRLYNPAAYGVTFTLRDAIGQKRLDCVRATDMIGAIFRNAGRPRFAHVRWCSETGGHSVAAFVGSAKDQIEPLLVDGLNPPAQPEQWPECYFHGHEWPLGLQNNSKPYCAELYVRGLDSYIWAEGYIIRGPNAGNLTSAAIPYSHHLLKNETRKVFDGPYEQ
jgi:hypothetical protein